jgi:hypothetical protein
MHAMGPGLDEGRAGKHGCHEPGGTTAHGTYRAVRAGADALRQPRQKISKAKTLRAKYEVLATEAKLFALPARD